MTFHPLVYKLLSFMLLKFAVIACLVGIFYLLRYLFKPKKKDLYKYKITYFFLNWFFVSVYFSFFIGLLFLLRLKRLSSLDLKPIKVKIIETYSSLGFIDFFLLSIAYIIIFLIFMMFLGQIRTFFINQLLKRHLYIKNTEGYFKQEPKNSSFRNPYDRFVFIFSTWYSYLTFTNYTFSYLAFGPLYKLFAWLNYWPEPVFRKALVSLTKKVQIFIRIAPILIMPMFITYDIYFNNWVITKVFYYLIPYMFYNLWKRYSDFLYNYDNILEGMVYDMYYKSDKVLYVNLPDEWEQLVYDFVDNGLQNKDEDIDTSTLYIEVCMKHKYLSDDGLKYTSPDRGHEVRKIPAIDNGSPIK
jgi:hypothetical protein